MNEERSDWIFYLKLSKSLPKHFLDLDREFKERGITLIPISISELMSVTKGEGSFNVMTSVRNFSEAKYFSKKVQKIFEFMMRSRRLNLFMASSFSYIDQTSIFGKTGKYHFYPLPVKIDALCATIAHEIYKQQSGDYKWPGASRGLGATVG